MKTRARWILGRLTVAAIAIPCALWIIPAPLSGYWHTPLSDCLCDSKNLLSFQDGKAYQCASGHGIVREEYGTYRRGIYSGSWITGKETVEIRPGWFLIQVRMPKDGTNFGGVTFWGFRELRPGYIKEVLATKQRKQPNKPSAANPAASDLPGAGDHLRGVAGPER